MNSNATLTTSRRLGAALLIGTVLSGWAAPALAQASAPSPAPAQPAAAPATAATAAPAPQQRVIRSISVRGAERLEPETVRSYANLAPGQTYDAEKLDQAIKDLYATELFADAQIEGADTGNLVIAIRENPVINRIVLEGNKRIKDDKITPEIKLAPRQIFTRSKVRSDVERIIELYKRQGRFGARVEPKTVNLDQNRVDLVFEISEGPLSKVRAINIIGNNAFPDGRLRKEMYTKQAGGPLGFIKSNDTYDPDRLAADQQKLRAFYLTQGYADFRVVSALAELTPDRRDFVITYVVEEGPRYKFGKISSESAIRDLDTKTIDRLTQVKQGDWFNAKAIEDAVTRLQEAAGALGYAFSDIEPDYGRNADTKTMDITFRVNETPRVYVDRIDISGNTVTRDKVIRREFRINEGDAFNTLKVKRSQDRIQSLGFFQDKLEIKQTQVAPDRVALGVDVEEKSTGQLSLSAGYSSLERFIISASVEQSNFRGLGQVLSAGINYSRYSKSIQLGFTEPYLFDKPILAGVDVFRRDLNSFNFVGNTRNTTYSQVSTGGGLRLGFALNEFVTIGTRYTLQNDKLTLDPTTFYTNGVCDPFKAGQYLCDQLGNRLTSSVGYTAVYDNTNGIRATRGQRLIFGQDFAGLGGDVRYVRTRADATKFWNPFGGFILSAHAEGGYIAALQSAPNANTDAVRITDRFFGQQLRGFDIRGIGPRIRRTAYNADGTLAATNNNIVDSLGGRAYYMGRIELEFPTSSGLRSLGIRPSAYIDAGSVFGLKRPSTLNFIARCLNTTTGALERTILPGDTNLTCNTTTQTQVQGFREEYLGDSPKPRLSVGIGFNWTSPFGPLRIDIAKALLKQEGDDTKLFSFNVGTQF
ncbi:outer membrane protein assembly factor BamA [Sphingomonas sp. KRR8]|uniref:outer membrane protein assembly factor BamA n=1 Tax=Sphingomonas sp. KRR8 TaxID=2942996 RepID=UPI0020223EE7|nr:outer membrane protein assembly factor BamA [Sphingomonas sp. KRR8]URD61642.1 outer membrane protein assembly factor BamA [Sphingomonas sp. KRR8]